MLKKINQTPHVVVGNVSIPIYEVASRPGTWRAVWKDHVTGKREAIQRASKKDLITATEKIAAELDKGMVKLSGLSQEEMFLCQRFLALKPDLALITRLEKEAALKQATLKTVFDQFIEEKNRSAKSSAANTRVLHARLKGLLPEFGERKMLHIQTEELDDWLFEADWADTTKIKTRAVVMQLFRWAKSKGFLDSAAEAENMFDGFDSKVEIKIYQPQDLWKMMNNVRPEFHPWLAVRAYAGVRQAELYRKDTDEKGVLQWEDINWERNEIVVSETVAKTGDERIIPMNTPLIQQLIQHRGKTGAICPHDPTKTNSKKDKAETTLLGELTSHGWIPNGLRKSHITYAIAIDGVVKTAENCGTSPQTIKKYYQKKLESRKELAEAWFKPLGSV